MAEQMNLKVKTRNGFMKRFKVSRRDTFLPFGADGSIFRSSERQQIIDYIVRSKIKDGGAELDESSELGKFVVQSFPLHMYSRLVSIRHSWVTFWKREKSGEVAKPWSPFSQPYYTTFLKLKGACLYFLINILNQPLDNIAEYFGESIAFYFAYMAFYTRWLFFPSILGLIVFCFQMSGNDMDHWLLIPYSVFVIIWACFMLVYWRQKSSYLAHRWGVLNYETEETDRPQFRGKYVYDESSGEVRKTYSLWKRVGKYFLTIPVMVLSIFGVLVVMTAVFASQEKLLNEYRAGEKLNFTPTLTLSNSRRHLFSDLGLENEEAVRRLSINELRNSDYLLVTFFYPCLYGILISIITLLFELVALWLNDFENHRTQTRYINRLILKIFSFEFVTVFTSLYYYAFTSKSKEVVYFQISVTIFSLMTVGQWWSVILNIFLPSFYQRALLYRMRANLSHTNRLIYQARSYMDRHRLPNNEINASIGAKLEKRIRLLEEARSKCWEEALLSKYDTFNDYTSVVIQIAFLLCFSAIFPLSPLIAMINNIFLIRVNAYKLCFTRQRPVAQKTGSIGVWEDVLQVMSVCGVLTNCALLGLTSTQLKDNLGGYIGGSGIAILLFVYEQGVIFFSYWLRRTIPKIPLSVIHAQARERKSLEMENKSIASPHSSDPTSNRLQRSTEDEMDDSLAMLSAQNTELNTNMRAPRLLGNKSRSMVIASQPLRTPVLQRSFSDYALLTNKEWGLHKRVTFDDIPRLFSEDMKRYRRASQRAYPSNQTSASQQETSQKDDEICSVSDSDSDADDSPSDDDYFSASEVESDDNKIPSELSQLGSAGANPGGARSMDPWDIKFSPEDSGRVSYHSPSPPQETGYRSSALSPVNIEIRLVAEDFSSKTSASSPKNEAAIHKLEEVLQSLKAVPIQTPNHHPPRQVSVVVSQPQAPPATQPSTAPLVSSPAAGRWFFSSENNFSSIGRSFSPFLRGSVAKSKQRTQTALDSIAPLSNQQPHQQPTAATPYSPPASLPPSSARASPALPSEMKSAKIRTPVSFAPPPSVSKTSKEPRQKELPQKLARRPTPMAPEFTESSLDLTTSREDNASSRRGKLIAAHDKQRKQKQNQEATSAGLGQPRLKSKSSRSSTPNGSAEASAMLQSIRHSDADDKVLRWKQRLSKGLLSTLERAQSPFYYAEHKDSQQHQQQQEVQRKPPPLPQKLSNSPMQDRRTPPPYPAANNMKRRPKVRENDSNLENRSDLANLDHYKSPSSNQVSGEASKAAYLISQRKILESSITTSKPGSKTALSITNFLDEGKASRRKLPNSDSSKQSQAANPFAFVHS